MTATRVVWALLGLCVFPIPSSGQGYALRLGLRGEGRGAFIATLPSDESLRVFPGERIEAIVTGALVGGHYQGASNEALTAALQPCLATGDVRLTVIEGGSITCLTNTGLTWTAVPEPWAPPCSLMFADDPTLARVHARGSLSGANLPAGTYTLVVMLEHAGLETYLGTAAARALRSNPALIVAGEATGQGEVLSELYGAANRAFEAQNWALAQQKANAILALYPKSALALELLAEAREEAGDATGAEAARRGAVAVLEANEDQSAAVFADAETRAARIEYLRMLLEDERE